MTSVFPPGLLLIAGAPLVLFLKGRARSLYLLFLPVLAFLVLLNNPQGTYSIGHLLGFDLQFKIDRLSLVFGYIFLLVTFIGMIYALHLKKAAEHLAVFLYAGGSLGVVFSGDFISFFIFWELMTVCAIYLIWCGNTSESRGAGFRYMMVHVFGGICLLAGIALRFQETGSIEFGYIGLSGLSSALIFLGFIINAAVPPLHAWLNDAYPEASVTGTVFLSAFTTKTAVYALARAFPGTEILVVAGAIMTVYPIFFAVLENDLRRVLSYSLINQVGFMLTGIGLGTAMAINGAVAHVFCHILYKALLFMSMGAVLYRTGTCKATELGGLYKTMPYTFAFCAVGAASISAFPLTSGFISKSMVLSSAGHENLLFVWIMLMFASAGVFHHAGIKVPFFTFLAHDSGKRPDEAPANMLTAMGIAAFLCIFIGVYPGMLYSILPFPVEYVPYTGDHVIGQLLLLLFAALAFMFLKRSGYYPPEQRAINLDTDWVYRKLAPSLAAVIAVPVSRLNDITGRFFLETIPRFLIWFGRNPSAALKIALDSAVYYFTPGEKRKNLAIRINQQKRMYPADRLYPWSVSAAVSFALLIFFICLILH